MNRHRCYWLDMNKYEPTIGDLLFKEKTTLQPKEVLLGMILTVKPGSGELQFRRILKVLTPNNQTRDYLIAVVRKNNQNDL